MVSGEFQEVSDEFAQFSSRFKDPVFVGTLMHRIAEEKQSTNLLLREINAKLDRFEALEKKIAELEARLEQREAKSNHKASLSSSFEKVQKRVLLPEVDEAIITFVREKGAVCAEDVQSKFAYKGKNAASARLNRLCNLNIVKKSQVGKKMYFELQEQPQ